MILMRANPLLGLLEGAGPENLNFLRAKMAPASLVALSGPKKVFSALTLPIVFVMDLPASKALSPAPYKQQEH